MGRMISVYVQLCFEISSVQQFLQIEVNQFQFHLEQFYIKIFKRTLIFVVICKKYTGI